VDPMNDLDRELSATMQVEPSAAFTARIRARIAAEGSRRQARLPRLALTASAVVALIVIVVTLPLPEPSPLPSPVALPHRPLAIVAPLPAPSRPLDLHKQLDTAANRVVISQSEMLALQRLFSGELVVPPAFDIAGEVLIPELTVDDIQVPVIPGGGGDS
jgi:hypothetical protein